MNRTSIQGHSKNNQNEEKKFDYEVKKNTSKEILDHRKLSNDETMNLYQAYQNNNLIKSKLEMYMNIKG